MIHQFTFVNRLWHFRPKFRKWSLNHQQTHGGFSLIELIVTSLLVSVVILVSWSGLISIMNMSAVAEARSTRQLEVNQALDFVTQELRVAKYVNATATSVVDGSTTNLSDLLTEKGFDLSQLGDYGDLSLYLEVPAQIPPPSICPADGPNAGSAPPSPSEYDQIIYDVRNSPSGWLGPRVLMRYGRLRSLNRAFNPCDSPVASDPIADALSDDATNTPSCTGVLTGGAGFYACQDNNQTQILFQNTLVDSQVQQASSGATSRPQTIQDEPAATTGCEDEANLRSLNSDQKSELKFFNQLDDSVKIYRLNASGTRQLQKTLNPNKESKQKTFVTHPWVVTDMDDACIAVFMPEDSKTTVAIIQ